MHRKSYAMGLPPLMSAFTLGRGRKNYRSREKNTRYCMALFGKPHALLVWQGSRTLSSTAFCRQPGLFVLVRA